MDRSELMDRYYLILEVLNLDKHAPQILADLLEEEGESTLANKTRNRKPDIRKMLQLGLELIPYRLSIQVATEYFQHAVSFGQPLQELDEHLAAAKKIFIGPAAVEPNEFVCQLKEIRDCLREVDLEQVELTIVGSLRVDEEDYFSAEDSDFAGQFRGCQSCYLELLRLASDLVHFEQEGNSSKVKSRRNGIGVQAQKVANHARNLPRIIRYLHQRELEADGALDEWERLPYATEQMQWQMDCLKRCLESAIQR